MWHGVKYGRERRGINREVGGNITWGNMGNRKMRSEG